MTTLERMSEDPDRYLLAAFLPDDEAAALERAARGDDEASGMIRASRALRAMIGDVAALRSDAASEPALAFLAAARLAEGSPDREWKVLLDRLERRVTERPESLAVYRRLQDRIRQLESGSDADAHFRRLSGTDPPRIRSIRPLLAAAAVLLIVATAGVLGRVLEDPVARAAHESVRRTARAAPSFRGAPGPAPDARRRAADARRLVLGLWPVYDRAALADLARDPADSDVPGDWLLVGQARLMLGDRRGAELALLRVTRPDPEAARLLQLIAEDD
jgi:hypothetical protein